MARINKDSDSWKAGGVRKRDFQHAHDEPEVPKKNPAKRNKKDTKRWCRGKEGREHVVVDKTPPMEPNFNCCPGGKETKKHSRLNHRKTIECQNCGMSAWRLPKEAMAQIEPFTQIQLEAEKKWCEEGHLFEWESDMIGRPIAFEGSLYLKNVWERETSSTWARSMFPKYYHWDYQFCVFCGKEGKSRRNRKE